MSALRPLAAFVLGGAILTGVAALSQVPYRWADPGASLIRLSWRARGERLERCRPATATELAGVPAHMRRDTICEGVRVPPYRLRVAIDGRVREDGIVAGSDVQGDRPIYVLREFPVQPGPHRLEVHFERQRAPGDDPAFAGDARVETRRAVPPRLALDTTVVLAEHAVVLVTLNDELGRLVVLGRPGAPRP